MKKTLAAACCAALAFGLAGCGGDDDSKTPEGVALSFSEAFVQGDKDKVLSLFDLTDSQGNEVKGEKREFAEMKISGGIEESVAKAKKEGGVKEVIVFDRADPEDLKKNRASVLTKIYFKNGTDKVERVKLVKKGEVWKVTF